ncbi:hypothetical protein NDU88_000310 [Pleurodeles waltl]|uniref:Uncharacterized protein n=1 Tax=Pleurodeles waltl TaxID=8319 RepID=A0AAV7VX55_PLEWA|nr:hypothetical protein NDU88_000310 [Pleurodeles waltl]
MVRGPRGDPPCYSSELPRVMWLTARACSRQRCCLECSNGRVRIERVRFFPSPASSAASLLLSRPCTVVLDARVCGPSQTAPYLVRKIFNSPVSFSLDAKHSATPSRACLLIFSTGPQYKLFLLRLLPHLIHFVIPFRLLVVSVSMEGQIPFSDISGNKDFGAFINEAMTKAMTATMSKMSKNIESSVQNMFYKSFMAHSAGDSRKRKYKDLSRQNDGALLTGEVSSPMTEDEMPPGPPSQEGNVEQVPGKRKSKTKNTIPAPKQIVISHISDTDDDVGDTDDGGDDSDMWGSLSQASPPKKPKLDVSNPFSAKIVLDSDACARSSFFGTVEREREFR